MPSTTSFLRLPVFSKGYYKLPGDLRENQFASTSTVTQFGGPIRRTTVSNPAWRKLIAKRQDASNPYLVEGQTGVTGRASCTVYMRGGSPSLAGGNARCFYNGMGSFPTDFTSFSRDSALQDLALTRLKRKLKTTIGSVSLMAPTAEVKELRGLIGQAVRMATGMVRTMIDIKRAKGGSTLVDAAETARKKAAEAWLAFNFGIRPLADDISNAVRAVEDYLRREDFGIRASASAKKEWQGGERAGPYTGTYGAFLMHTIYLHHRLSYRWYCGGATTLGAGNHYGISEHLGLTSDDILPTLWELTPYSWVVDYFTTVGVFLDDIFWVLPGILSYSGCTRRYELKGECENYFAPWGPSSGTTFEVSSKPGFAKFTRFEFERVPFGANLPHVGLHVRSFDEIGHFGVTKLLNLASVLAK